MRTSLPARPHASQGGFSLIEAMVAALVIALVAASAFYFLAGHNRASVNSNDLLKGLNLGKLKMDSLKVAEWDSLEAGSDTVADRYIRSWNVTPQTGLKRLEMTVYWPLTAEHSVSFTSLMSDYRYKEDE